MAIPYPNIPAETAETAGQYRAKIDANFEAINNFETDDIPEGSNEYFTDARAQDVVKAMIVNDLGTGGADAPLSAEQGKTLNTNKAEKTKMFYPDNVYGGIITANFNTLSVSGSYTGFGTAVGAPNTSQSWFIRHINSNSGTTTAYQEAIGYTDGAFYTRRKVSGVWNDWVLEMKMVDSRDGTTHDILFSVTTDGYPALTIS